MPDENRISNSSPHLKNDDTLTLKAVDHVRLQFGSSNPFPPLFVHQQFEKEEVYGFENLNLTVRYDDPSCDISIEFTYDSIQPKHTDLAVALSKSISSYSDASKLKKSVETNRSGILNFTSNSTQWPVDVVWHPPGKKVGEYSVGSDVFHVYKWQLGHNTPSTPWTVERIGEYHDRMSTLSMWLIENASPINNYDPKWHIIAVYKHSLDEISKKSIYNLVGYTTLFLFLLPFSKTKYSRRLRLGQMIVLPSYQRSGHGKQMLHSIYKEFFPTDGGEIQDLTVESPCDDMKKLMQSFNLDLALDVFKPQVNEILSTLQLQILRMDEPVQAPLVQVRTIEQEEVTKISALLRISLNEAYKVAETLLFACIDRSDTEGDVKQFRLGVKRRIFSTDEDIKGTKDVELRKKMLELEYLYAIANYSSALSSRKILDKTLAEQAWKEFDEYQALNFPPASEGEGEEDEEKDEENE
jgi:ribosomal protein S18 acetylase RimI-like enzyme/putative ubiquitin-RnfH superfamily antitoxin RatB of RatAB toxin-antitoxin module